MSDETWRWSSTKDIKQAEKLEAYVKQDCLEK